MFLFIAYLLVPISPKRCRKIGGNDCQEGIFTEFPKLFSERVIYIFVPTPMCRTELLSFRSRLEESNSLPLGSHMSREAVIYPMLNSQFFHVSLMGYSLAVCPVALAHLFFRLRDQAKPI